MDSPSHLIQSPAGTQALPQPDLPCKRAAPEDEVQFVSAKPVKKRRTSLPTGQKPGAFQQPDKTPSEACHDASKDQPNVATTPNDQKTSPTTSNEEPIPTTSFVRGTLMPGMECFTFPQVPSSTTGLRPPSSPALSPKQLLLEVSHSCATEIPNQLNMDLVPFSDLLNSAGFEGFGSPWELANWIAPPTLMTPEVTVTQRMLSPPSHLQPDAKALGPPSDYTMTLPSPMPSTQFCLGQANLNSDVFNNVQQVEKAQNGLVMPPKEQSPQTCKETTPPSLPSDQKPNTPQPGPSQEPNASNTKQEASLQSQEQHGTKQPCLICARLRQQAMMNQSSGNQFAMIPSATSAAEHHFHGHPSHPPAVIATEPSQGLGPAPQMRYQYLNPSIGMMYANGVAPVNAALRPVPPYIYGSVLAQTAGLPGPQATMTPPFVAVHNPHSTQPTKRQTPVSAKRPAGTSSPSGEARAPAASKRKPPPNLIVDVAETCEEVFPFDEVAQRHSVPRHKVVEVFSAIVQLPLLRCATDKRRSGKLAQTRMRKFTKAKKDMQAASNGAAQGKPEAAQGMSQEKKLILPGVMELARNMPPVEYPGVAKNGFTGLW